MKTGMAICVLLVLLFSLTGAPAEETGPLENAVTAGAEQAETDDAVPEAELLPEEPAGEKTAVSVVIPWSEGNERMIGILPAEIYREGTAPVVDAGKVGKDAFWAVSTDGALHIVGSGPMDQFGFPFVLDESDVPWSKYRDRITGAVIHEGITGIAKYTFSSCPKMKTIQIGSTVTDLADTTIWSSGVEEFIVDPWNPVFASVDGVLYSKDMSTLVYFPPHREYNGFELPLSVTRISSFAGNEMSSIRIPNQVRWIDAGAFSHCRSLREVVLPMSLEKIGEKLFSDVSSLTSVTIPASVVSIGESAFYYCEDSLDIWYEGTKSQWNQIDIETRNYAIMAGTVHFQDRGTFSAVQDGEYFWDTKARKTAGLIGKVRRENAGTETLGQGYQISIPADWEAAGSGMFVGRDADGNIARLRATAEQIGVDSGSGFIGLSEERVTNATLNGIDVSLAECFTAFSEYVTVCFSKGEWIFTISVDFDNNLPLQAEKLAEDAAFIFGSLCEAGHEAMGEMIIGRKEEEKRCTENLQEFFFYWSGLEPRNMLEFCSSSWKEVRTGDLKSSLLTVVPEGRPLMCELENLDMTEDCAVAQAGIQIDRQDGRDPVKYHFAIRMVKENGEWLIDPESLGDYEEVSEEWQTETPEPTMTLTPEATPVIPAWLTGGDAESCRETLARFLSAWNRDSLDEMLDECSGVWKAIIITSPKMQLVAFMANRTPLNYTLYDINVQGDDAYAELTMLTDRNNGKDPVNYRFSIHLVREGNKWYIDPPSLMNYGPAEEPREQGNSFPARLCPADCRGEISRVTF